MSGDDKQIEYLTRKQLMTRINRAPARTQFMLSVGAAAPQGDGKRSVPVYAGGCMTVTIRTSRPVARQAVRGMLTDEHERDGCRIRVWWWKSEPKTIWFGN